jgi:hypothetical protein
MFRHVRGQLRERLKLTAEDFDSLIRGLQDHLELSMSWSLAQKGQGAA